MKKLSTIFTILAILSILALAALTRNQGEVTTMESEATPIVTIDNTTPSPNVTYSFHAEANGQTAYELLKNKAEVEFSETTQGVVVFSVNGIKNTDERRWVLLVNGQQATQAAEKTMLRSQDEVLLSYDQR